MRVNPLALISAANFAVIACLCSPHCGTLSSLGCLESTLTGHARAICVYLLAFRMAPDGFPILLAALG